MFTNLTSKVINVKKINMLIEHFVSQKGIPTKKCLEKKISGGCDLEETRAITQE